MTGLPGSAGLDLFSLGALPAFFGIALATSVILLAPDASESLTDVAQYATGAAVFVAFSATWMAGVLYSYRCNQWRKRWLPYVIELFPTTTLLLWCCIRVKDEMHQPIVLGGVFYLASLVVLLTIGAISARRLNPTES